MSTVLKSNREHSFDIELAIIVGIEKAILLKNISYWCEENERRGIQSAFVQGIWWTPESFNSLVAKYPYMKKTSINRWMNELHADRWIRMFSRVGGKNFYAPGETYTIWNTGGDWKSAIRGAATQNTENQVLSQNGTPQVSQNGIPPELSQNGTPLYQNGIVGVPKWDTGVYQNGIHNIEIHIDSNIDSNVECVARAEKKPGFKKSFKKTSPSSAAPPPQLLFAASPWANISPASWADSLLPLCDDLPGNLDCGYYLGRCRSWSAEKGGLSADWLATAARFAHEDQRKGKLVTINYNNHHDTTGHSTATDRKPFVDPAKVRARTERILRRSGLDPRDYL